jgi:UDP-N-acetylglucosamine 1-carboxyvinyltransferase
MHLKGLAALGADLRIENGHVVARARRLRGARICLLGPRGPTVTGTANVMMAAALARGQSTIVGAAREPEVVDLGQFLNSCGARIEGLGESTISITGVEQLGGSDYRIIPDRIETATLLIAAAITRGSITVAHVVPSHLTAVLEILGAAGAQIAIGDDWIKLEMNSRPRPLRLTALPYPGVPSDIQAQFTALAALAYGDSQITDHVFPERFQHLPELTRMGAAIERRGHQITIAGRDSVHSAVVTATDLRASSALVLAALVSRGTSLIRRIDLLDRGYQRLEEKLNSLGARIRRHRPARRSPAVAPSLRTASAAPLESFRAAPR